MRQLSLQGFPDGAIRIGSFLSVLKKDGVITYFLGNDNFYSHPESDRAGQRFAIATLIANGHVRSRDVECSALGIPRRTLANWTLQLAERGPGSFFEARATRGQTVITAEKSAECGRLLDEGATIADTARLAKVGDSTLRKAIAAGRVRRGGGGGDTAVAAATSKSGRSRIDAQASQGMGTACTRAEEIPGTKQVVNPAWRSLDKSVRVNLGRIRKLQAELGSQMLRNEGGNIQINAELLDDIQTLESETEQLRRERRQTDRKVKIESLPLDQRPSQLRPLGKMLADTVKMIAYRAETALVGLLRPHLSKEEEARALIRELFVSSADLEPDEKENTLTVRIHRMACPAHDKAIGALLDDLTAEAFLHPETGMRMIYKLA